MAVLTTRKPIRASRSAWKAAGSHGKGGGELFLLDPGRLWIICVELECQTFVEDVPLGVEEHSHWITQNSNRRVGHIQVGLRRL